EALYKFNQEVLLNYRNVHFRRRKIFLVAPYHSGIGLVLCGFIFLEEKEAKAICNAGNVQAFNSRSFMVQTCAKIWSHAACLNLPGNGSCQSKNWHENGNSFP